MSNKILIVDDDHNFCETLEDILNESGYDDIIKLYDGAELLRGLEEISPDLILLDVTMPHLGAISVIDEISKEEKFKNIPIIIITGQKELKNSFDSNENVHAFFVKPLDPLNLVSKISEIFGGSKNFDDQDRNNGLEEEDKYKSLQIENEALKEMIRQNDQRFYNVVGKSLDGVVITDEANMVVYCNPACQEIFGYLNEEIVGENITKILKEKYNDESVSTLKNASGITVEIKGKRKDTSTFPIEISETEIIIDDKPHKSRIIRDVSERINAEEEREKLISKITKSNDKLTRFAYVCSHDLKEPITVISGFSDLLRKRLDERLQGDETSQSYINFIVDNTKHALNLIANTLDYSMLEHSVEKYELTNLEEVIENIKSGLHLDNGVKKGTVSCESLPNIVVNKTQIIQLFQNLISNGLKYNENNASAYVKINAKDSGNDWIFSVADNGIGIEERYFNKIFDLFSRLHHKEKFSGYGVGLSVCKEVVENHKGKIWVESRINEGTTFYFTIPKN